MYTRLSLQIHVNTKRQEGGEIRVINSCAIVTQPGEIYAECIRRALI